MAECPDGRTNRGTRSQFRIGLPGLGVCKGFYPINLEKIMDAGQSSQISSSSSTSSRDLISPCKGTHTLTVREYEQTIDELKKENFNLKLKLYLCEETHKKACRDEDSSDEMVQVVVHLNSEAESFRAKLEDKEKLLQDALERAEALESDFKELQKLNADLQAELASFSELPTKEEISSLLKEKENFLNHISTLENLIKEKDEEISTLNQQIEIVASKNTVLEEKIKKRSLAIQGFVYKNYKEKEMLPDELRNIVISAIQAAKNKNKDELFVATKAFTSALKEIMSSCELSLNQSKENIGSPSAMCLKEETLEKSSSSFLSSQSVSPTHIAQIQSPKDVFSERDMSVTKQTEKLDSVVHHPFIRGKIMHQNAVNIAEKDFIEFCDISPSTEENLISFSEKSGLQTGSVTEHNLINIESVSSSPVVCKLIAEKDTSESDQLVNILKENEQLKHDLQEKFAIIEDLRAACEKSKEESKSDAFKASQEYCASTQTEISGNKLLNKYEILKLQKVAKLSDNGEELREDILLLLLAIDEKDKELSDVKQSLAVVQEDLKKALSTTNMLEKDFYLHERNELHERLALSCSVNEELMKHLKKLERFMEDLLQHKFDSSLESITDKSAFVSSVSSCLNKSLNLSRILSDQLSVCEGSKLFEECESFSYKNGSHLEEKDLPYLSLDRLSMDEQQQSSYLEYVSKNSQNSLKIGKESDSSQLCWRCWQQLNPPLNQLAVSHLTQNNIMPKPIGYQSSDTDIWSEPDRNVSMQRIGISLQNSPVSSKSPRKLRQKDKRISSRTSSKENTSSSDCQQACKKRQGSASRRLFVKENAKAQDFPLEKFYFLVLEKFSKLKSLLDDLESIKDGKLSNEGWVTLNRLVMAVGETFQKLHSVKENAKISPVCGKCAILELFSNIKVSHTESNFFIEEDSSTTEQKILQEFSKEFCLLKEACKEPFSLLYESVSKKSASSQSDTLIDSEHIKKLKSVINDLNAKNDELNENLEKVKHLLSKEKDALVSVKTEKFNLLTEIDNLKIDLLDMKYKEKELSLKNEKLANELTCFSKNNSELNSTLTDLEQKRKESDTALEQLTVELQKNKSDLIHMNEKCLEYEKQLNEQIHMRENSENKLKNLESEFLSEKNYYLRKIDDLNAEKNHYIQELKTIQEKRLALEKENAIINDRLQFKNNELLSLKETIEKLQSIKETQNDIENGLACKEKIVLESIKSENIKLLNAVNHLQEESSDMKYKEEKLSLENKNLIEELNHINESYSELNSTLTDLKQKMEDSCSTADELKAELQKNRLDLAYMSKKCLSYEKQLEEQIKVKEKYANELKTLESNSLAEKNKYLNQLDALNAEKDHYEQELKNVQEKMLVLEKENAVINNSFRSKNDELLLLQKAMEKLQKDKEEANRMVSKMKESLESIKIENHELSNKINQLEEELSQMKNKEKKLYLKNEKLVEELSSLSKNNSELNSTLKDLEQKRKESSIALEQLTVELQKNKSDLIHMNEKCLEYERQLNEQVHLRENGENKLKNLESESLNEKNYYLRKIDDLNAEKNNYVQDLKALQENRLSLEKENAIIKDRLQFKNSELLSLKNTIEKLQSVKETQNDMENEFVSKENIILESLKAENLKLLSQVNHLKEELLDMKYKEKELSFENGKLVEKLDQINEKYSELNSTLKDLKQKKEDACSAADQLKAELQKNLLDITYMNKKCLSYEKQLNEQIQMKEKCESQLKTLECNSSNERQNYQNQLEVLNAEKNHCEQELKKIQEKMLVLEKENMVINNTVKSKDDELLSLQKTIEEFQITKKALISEHEKEKELSESIKIENRKLLNKINQLEKELSHMKNKEKELCLENEKLNEELSYVNKNNSELSNALKILEQKTKESSIALEQLTVELQKNKSDLIHMNEKCLEYERQLNEQVHLRENSENKLKNLESESLSEKNYYLHKIDDLNAEKNNYVQELKALQENRLALEKENAIIKDRLQFKSNELLSLKNTIEKLQNVKETQNDMENELVSKENIILESLKTENLKLLSQINHLKEELLDMKYKEKELSFENGKLVEKLDQINEKYSELNSNLKDLKQKKESSESIKIENRKLSSQIKQFEEELSCMKNKEKELCLENEKLVEELNKINKSNSKLNTTLKVLEEKRKASSVKSDELTVELQKNRSDLAHLSEKCLAYEKQLAEQIQLKEKYENELKTQESNLLNEQKYYLSQINELNSEKDHYLQELKSIRENKLVLEKEIIAIKDELQSKNNELFSLGKTVEELRKAKETLRSNYEKLQRKLENNQESLTNLQEKCKKGEEVIAKLKGSEDYYCQQLKQHKTESLTEKEKLLNEVSALKKEKENILQKLKDEKESYDRLEAKNVQLNESCLKSSEQICTLKQRNEFFENALLSSNKECDILNKDLKCLRNTLQNLESKCLSYEKQLVAASGMKDNLIECLLNINNEFSIQRQKLNETCKIYGNDDSVVWDETSKFIPIIDEDNVPKLCENVISETKKLSQSVDMLLSILKSYHLKSVETETSKEKNQSTQSLKKQMEFFKAKVENLHLQNEQLQHIIDDLKESMLEKEKSLQSNAHEIETLKRKLLSSQKEIDRINQLIQKKDDEITKLQERIFNLQTYMSTILTDKKNMLVKATSITEKPENSFFSNNQLPSTTVLTDTKMCQTDECEDTTQNVDESFTSVSSLEAGKNHCCEKYRKRCYSVQAKLDLCRKRIEILEKDRDDLKERYLQQLQGEKDSVERNDSAVSKLGELESKLEKKKLFISELKSELSKTWNELIDKEKEVEDLKEKLAECKVKSKHEALELSKTHPTATLSSVNANITTLKNHKWKLIQTIFDIQRKFYEKKGIHLNYFDRFKEHVNNLYSLQLIPSVSKSESMPLLRSYALKEQYELGNEKVKKIADLELDIECLQNLKIFLNRFLVPCVFQIPETSEKQTEIEKMVVSSDQLSLPIETKSQKESKDEIIDIFNLPFPEASIMTNKENAIRIDVIASVISQHLDCIEKFLDVVAKRNWLEVLEVEGSVNKPEIKSILLKIIQEINVLHEGADKLFNLNAHLKSFDFVASLQAPLSTTKLDASDRESIMSEETIAVSRTESPMSFEDTCPIKLPHPETLQLEENNLKLGSIENKVTVIEPYNNKVTVIDGSCDSVCQRSHYSSPDLGIESDPNHDSSAPEHKEDGTSKYQRFSLKPQVKTAFTNAESAGRWSGPKFGETFYAVGTLPHYELLKQEIKESLVAIKSVLSRTGDGLHHIAKYTSPRKTLEYNTLKSIKDTCIHMDVCLKEANNLIGKFWTAPCPTEKEWKVLKDENEKLSEELRCLKVMIEKQENDFKTAMGKLQHAQAVKDNMEKKISKKLVKTKKLIRQAELRLLETRCQNFPPVPKYPVEQIEQTDTRHHAH